MKIFLVLTCIEVLPSTINYFLSFFYWPVNCASLVYKLYITFQTQSNMQTCLCYIVLVLDYREISRVCHFFGHFGMSLNCRSWVLQITQHIPDKDRNWSNIYAWSFLALSYICSNFRFFLVFRLFWSNLQILQIISGYLIFWGSVDIGGYLLVPLFERWTLTLAYFSDAFLWPVDCTCQACISYHTLGMDNFLFQVV